MNEHGNAKPFDKHCLTFVGSVIDGEIFILKICGILIPDGQIIFIGH